MKTALKRITAAVVVAVVMVPAAAGAQGESPTEERFVRGENHNSWGEGRVNVESLGALTTRAGGGASGGGSSGGCSWRVAWRSQGPLGETLDALSVRGELSRADVAVDASYSSGFRLDLDSRGAGLIEGGADRELLRFVVPYGSRECDAASGAFVTLAEVQDLARAAFADIQRRWPSQEVVLGWPEPTEDTWTALSTNLAWEPISAVASSGGLTVTVTATPVRAEWDTGQINTRIGGERTVVCDGPGEMPRMQADASCRVWLASPSTGLVDRNGVPDTISLGLTVEWQVGYTSNIAGFSDPAWLVWPTVSFLDGVVVNTTQSVPISMG